MCAKRLINLGGVKTVYYANPYRLLDAVDMMAQAGIKLIHLATTEAKDDGANG